MVLDVSDDDPSTTKGCTDVLLNLLHYTPVVSPCGEVRRKTAVFGDQGLVGLSRKCISSRSDEKAPERLNSLVPQPMDWHAKKVVKHILVGSRSWRGRNLKFGPNYPPPDHNLWAKF